MESAIELMNNMVYMVNKARERNAFELANEHLDMLCGAMCIFNEYERVNGRQVTLGEVNNRVFIQVSEV
jgi:hypothetical protein